MAQNVCDKCGYPIEPGIMYCINCGNVVSRRSESGWDVPRSQEGSGRGGVWPEPSQNPRPMETVLVRPSSTSQSQPVSQSTAQPTSSGKPQAAKSPGWCPKCGARYNTRWVYCISCGETLFPAEQPVQKDGGPGPSAVGWDSSQVFPPTGWDATGTGASATGWDATGSSFTGWDGTGTNTGGAGRVGVGTSPVNLGSFGARPEMSLDADIDDSLTMVLGDNELDEEDDAPTMIYEEQKMPRYSLKRLSTGDDIVVELPASVGRGSAADIRVSGDLGISRVHLRLDVVDGQVVVIDQRSANGTWVNDVKLVPGEQQPIENGDTLRMAKEEFTFQVE